ncbi:sulfur carrier protein ThiS [Salinicoccus halodurans]|uniref:Sulfur carrier protein n=1 Tax=Salinicoccus halodurans TaxID=407035 RepID=A0A0F7HK40_9STAP|nr:sulfur carrier protein ThiS [Salinicoccus halodurans]AKG73847.1 thiamine biosynthesis protein ThiS [Salinicoccus halodurans]SFK56757.1 sulfur carrier protein [Salinicoccus halodurans]
MNLVINGNSMELGDEVSSVTMLLEHLGLAEKPLIIEHNQDILQKEHYRQVMLENGDTLEIVHFVGGG